MSRNYINGFLKPFRESKVVESLLGLLKLGGSNAGGLGKGSEKVIGVFPFCFCWVIGAEVMMGFRDVSGRCRGVRRVRRGTARGCAK